jgi:hypothetical protein
MAKILLMISLAAASLAAKDRAWQTGSLLDKSLNPYFKTASSGDGGGDTTVKYESYAVSVNVHHSSGDVIYDDYVVEGPDTVYMVEVTRFKSSKAAHLSLSLPVTFAVEKNKLFIKDLDRDEYEGQILKQIDKDSWKKGDVVAAAEPKPAPVKQEAPAKVAKAPAAPPPAPAKPQPKPDPFALASVTAPAPQTPAVAQPPAAKPAPKLQAAVTTPAAQPQSTAKPVQPVTKPSQPAAKPDTAAAARSASRAWQSGQLLSIVNNSYFLNVTYSSDSDGSTWPFAQGSDGRYTVNGQIGNPTTSLYTYDNYVIESQFCVYLVQRMRPKTSTTAHFAGNKPLKFAVEKTKLWLVDEENIEYETKVIKLVQKDSIVDPLTRAAAR